MIGINLEAIMSIATSIMALVLFTISLIAFKRQRRSRRFYVMAAFFLFSVKGVLFATNEILGKTESLEWASLLLDLGILTLFFLGMVRE